MSVPEFLRNARSMRVYTMARSILKHTRQVMNSEKNLPKRDRWLGATDLNKEATKMFLCTAKANAIHPTTAEDYKLRRRYLVKAKAHAEALCWLLDLEWDAGHFRGLSMDFWYGEIDEFLKQLSGLRNKDRERFGKLE